MGTQNYKYYKYQAKLEPPLSRQNKNPQDYSRQNCRQPIKQMHIY